MSKKFRRSAVALVLAATMVLSSQGVLTAFADTTPSAEVSAESAYKQIRQRSLPNLLISRLWMRETTMN